MPIWLQVAKEVFQILFFTVIGTVTVLTFIKAKRTLLQPIRTEVFKEQLKAFTDVLSHFNGKGEIELRRSAGIDDFFGANVTALYDIYAHHFFDIEMKEGSRPYDRSKCPMSRISFKEMEGKFQLADEHIREVDQPPKPPRPDPRTRAAIWHKHTHAEAHLPRSMVDFQNALMRLRESPLVPTELANLLSEYSAVIDENVTILCDVLTAAAKEMPEKYPTLEAMKKSSFGWIHARYQDKFKQLKPPADAITGYLRSYFGTEELFE
ncbi:MAG: hypothetical protein NVV63_18270 [Opitutus sp.]|nr:hypothetical protein [Opitutus sp.]